MLKDLCRADWLACLDIPEARVPKVLLLRGTRNLKAAYDRHADLFEDPVAVGSPNGLFEDVLLGWYAGVPIAYASVYGDALASEVTHLFGVLGTELVIQTGCCGAFGAGIEAGDVVCATSAHCGEGAAQYYLPDHRVLDASPEVVHQLVRGWDGTMPLHQGPIWTTSALFAEGREELLGWAKAGCIAADMETATAFAVAEYFGVRRASLLYVFDNPREEEHLLAEGAALQARREAGDAAMVDAALRLISRYE